MNQQSAQHLFKHSSQQMYKHCFLDDHTDGSLLLKPHLKTDAREDRSLYEEEERKEDGTEGSIRQRIELAMTVVEQNEELAKMIALVQQQIGDQDLKGSILEGQIKRKSKDIEELTAKLQDIRQANQKIKLDNLNESVIPLKSVELSATYNSSWVSQLLSREELQSLWTQRSKAKLTMKKQGTPVKTYKLDLNAAVMSDRMKKSKGSSSSGPREQSMQNQGKKSERVMLRPQNKISSVAYKSRQASKRYDLKIDVNDKQMRMAQMWEKTKSKPLSYLRNAKKAKNPEV